VIGTTTFRLMEEHAMKLRSSLPHAASAPRDPRVRARAGAWWALAAAMAHQAPTFRSASANQLVTYSDATTEAFSMGPVHQRGNPMHRSPGQHRHARRPALEQYEDRILQSIAVEPVGNQATQLPETAYTPGGSRVVLLSRATLDHASRIFDDPFFFDAN
jgi:hypothetical protein